MRVCPREGADVYKPANEVRLPSADTLESFRTLVLGARAARVSVSEGVSEVRSDVSHALPVR